MSRRITEFEYADLGTDHAQYFPGVGVAGTRWENVYLGVGESVEEAMNDAAENAAQSCEWADIPSAQDGFSPVPDAHSGCEVNAPEHDECEWQHYVALFIR